MGIKSLYGIEVPQSLRENVERATAYVAGTVLARKSDRIEKVPAGLQEVCKRYASNFTKDVERSGLMVPEVTPVESSFWAGYLTGASSLRDKERSGAYERHIPDAVDMMNQYRFTRNLEKELAEMCHTDFDVTIFDALSDTN
ncbi:MAG: hypothetical protein AABX11_02265 [Nanoarchaeota archaeon]